jgi:hypothetical protein
LLRVTANSFSTANSAALPATQSELIMSDDSKDQQYHSESLASASSPIVRSHNTILLTGAAGMLGKQMRNYLRMNCDKLRLSDRAACDPAIDEHEEV